MINKQTKTKLLLFTLVFSLAHLPVAAATIPNTATKTLINKPTAKVAQLKQARKDLNKIKVKNRETVNSKINQAKKNSQVVPVTKVSTVKTVQNQKPLSVAKTSNSHYLEKVALAKESKLTTKKVSSPTKLKSIQKTKKVHFKVVNTKENKKYAKVYIGNTKVLEFRQAAGGYSQETRAKIFAYKLKKFITKKGNPNDILPGLESGIPVGRVKSQVLFTVDNDVAKLLKITKSQLAIRWVNNIREALGAPKISRDFARVASRSSISLASAEKSLRNQQRGLASWYGGKFHGRKTADGSTYNKYNFTAAHRTLPLGTFVRVTNLNNNKHCIVKITDRGPFIKGRIIDLSSGAAKHLEMLSDGVAKVSVEVVNRF